MEESKYTFNVTVQPGGNNFNVVENYYAGSQPATRLPNCMEDRKLVKIYQFLINKKFIAETTLSNNFVYMMGGTEVASEVKPIEWTGNVQELREMLTCAFRELIDRRALKMADIEKIVPFCFSKGGKPLSLAKNDSRKETGIITNFFANLATM